MNRDNRQLRCYLTPEADSAFKTIMSETKTTATDTINMVLIEYAKRATETNNGKTEKQ